MGSSSLTRDRTQDPCVGSVESQPLDHQGSPVNAILEVPPFLKAAFFKKKKEEKLYWACSSFLSFFLFRSQPEPRCVAHTHARTHTHAHTHRASCTVQAGLGHPPRVPASPGVLPALESWLFFEDIYVTLLLQSGERRGRAGQGLCH